MQYQFKRTDPPTTTTSSTSSTSTSTVRGSKDVAISIVVPPIISVGIGESTTDLVSSSVSLPQSSSSVSSTTQGKGVVTSLSAVTSGGSNGAIPVPTPIGSSVGGAVDITSGTIGNAGTPNRKNGGGRHIRLTCVAFTGRAAYPMPVVTSKASSENYGAAALTMETITNYGTAVQPFATRSSDSYPATSTSGDDFPDPSNTSQVDMKRGKIPRDAIIGIVLVFVLLWIGSVLLILRRRRILLRDNVATTTRSSQKYRDHALAYPRSSLREFTFGGRSRRLISLDDEEEGALASHRFTESEGSTRAGKRLPSIIIHPSVSNFHRPENQARLSISSTSSSGSQYIFAEPRQIEVPQPLSDPFSSPVPVTPTESLISIRPRIPEIAIHPPPSHPRLTAYRRMDRVIPPIPPLPSSPPPLPPIPPGSPSRGSRDPRDPFKDPFASP